MSARFIDAGPRPPMSYEGPPVRIDAVAKELQVPVEWLEGQARRMHAIRGLETAKGEQPVYLVAEWLSSRLESRAIRERGANHALAR